MQSNNKKEFYNIQELKKILKDSGYVSGVLLEFTGDYPFLSQRDFWNFIDDFDIYELSNKQYCEDLLFLFGEPLMLIDITDTPPDFISNDVLKTGFCLKFMYENKLFCTTIFEGTSSGLDIFKRIFAIFDPNSFLPEQDII